MDRLYKDVVQLQNKFRNYIDQPHSAAGNSLEKEIQRLENDVQSKKNKSSLEARVRGIIRILENTDSSVMDDRHLDDLRDRCMDLIQDIKKL
jgi:hypothetical protein